MLYIKGFDKDLKCRGYQFQVGKEYKIENDKTPELCSNSVFHFCESLSAVHNFYTGERKEGNRFCYIESLSEVVQDDSKFGCKHIKIVKEIVGDELNILLCLVNNNTGVFNTGYNNTGSNNIGSGNTCDKNIGDYNSGCNNIGSNNTGSGNIGDNNNGYKNIGYNNSGDGNSGNSNTGNSNTGNSNTGNSNTGFGNSGSGNNGDGNIGLFNSCNFSTGIFCNKQDNIKMFNIDSGMTMKTFTQSKYYTALCSSTFILTRWDEKQNKIVPIEYKEACKNWWDNMDEKNKAIILSMPNFDKEVFEDITGIKIN